MLCGEFGKNIDKNVFKHVLIVEAGIDCISLRVNDALLVCYHKALIHPGVSPFGAT